VGAFVPGEGERGLRTYCNARDVGCS
jgi:hypothetical protein